VIANIINVKPDVVFCDLVGDSQTAFYKQYANYGLSDMGIQCVNVALDDLVATAAGWDTVEGMIACYDYFPAVGGDVSDAFVDAYEARFDDGSVPASASEVPYLAVKSLAQALEQTDDYSSGKAIAALFSGMSVEAPDGTVKFDESNHHVAVPLYIAVAHDGNFEILYSEEELIAPLPFGEE
jgi:ABC-type branched-subunit amino acid transport system substrate-binding protein